jgi:hypothetical protein
MTQEEKEKAMLADDLSAYINEKHTQEECIGFIDGYKSALSKLKKLRVAIVISRLKSIRRFNLANYREGEFGIDTEREYDCNGDYIDSYEIDEVISELENGL